MQSRGRLSAALFKVSCPAKEAPKRKSKLPHASGQQSTSAAVQGRTMDFGCYRHELHVRGPHDTDLIFGKLPRTPFEPRFWIVVAVGTTIADRPPRRSVRARLRIRLLLWMNGGETCCLPHTVQFLGHALPALCRTHVGWNDVLLSPCPSLPSLRRRLLPFVVRLVHRHYGPVRLLLYVHVRRAVYGLRGPVLVS